MKFPFAQCQDCSIHHCQGQPSSRCKYVMKLKIHREEFCSAIYFSFVEEFLRAFPQLPTKLNLKTFHFHSPAPTLNVFNRSDLPRLGKYLQRHSWSKISSRRKENEEFPRRGINLKHFSFRLLWLKSRAYLGWRETIWRSSLDNRVETWKRSKAERRKHILMVWIK